MAWTTAGSLFDHDCHERIYPDESIIDWLTDRVERQMDLAGKPWRWSDTALEIIDGFDVDTGGKSKTA